MKKVLIVSLPRSGTTSACVFLLEHGFKVAHTAFTSGVIEQADVLADTPVFADYVQLLKKYPDARVVYLVRSRDCWLASINRLLSSMKRQWRRQGHIFEAEIERCFKQVFPNFLDHSVLSEEYLGECLDRHLQDLELFCRGSAYALEKINIEHADAGRRLLTSLGYCERRLDRMGLTKLNFPHVNRDRRITYWDSVQHKNKLLAK